MLKRNECIMLWKINEVATYLHSGFITFSKEHKFQQHSSSILRLDNYRWKCWEGSKPPEEGFLSNRQDHELKEENVIKFLML